MAKALVQSNLTSGAIYKRNVTGASGEVVVEGDFTYSANAPTSNKSSYFKFTSSTPTNKCITYSQFSTITANKVEYIIQVIAGSSGLEFDFAMNSSPGYSQIWFGPYDCGYTPESLKQRGYTYHTHSIALTVNTSYTDIGITSGWPIYCETSGWTSSNSNPKTFATGSAGTLYGRLSSATTSSVSDELVFVPIMNDVWNSAYSNKYKLGYSIAVNKVISYYFNPVNFVTYTISVNDEPIFYKGASNMSMEVYKNADYINSNGVRYLDIYVYLHKLMFSTSESTGYNPGGTESCQFNTGPSDSGSTCSWYCAGDYGGYDSGYTGGY